MKRQLGISVGWWIRGLALGWAGIFCALTSFARADANVATPASTVETIIAIRHGEKPPDGIGQLNIRGLNRSLALPSILEAKYGKPDYIIAPNPKDEMTEHGVAHCYVRPLMTLAPTAIHFQMPMLTPCGFSQIEAIQQHLEQPVYANARIFLAWEHLNLVKIMAGLVQVHGGDPAQIPAWPGKDYDSIYVLKITRNASGPSSVQFSHEYEGLNSLSDQFPSPR